jgi:hypothetical protein
MALRLDEMSAPGDMSGVVENDMDVRNILRVAPRDISEYGTQVEYPIKGGMHILVEAGIEKTKLDAIQHPDAGDDRSRGERRLAGNVSQRLYESLTGIQSNKDLLVVSLPFHVFPV